jgi:outer membrane protein assembly factor BamB
MDVPVKRPQGDKKEDVMKKYSALIIGMVLVFFMGLAIASETIDGQGDIIYYTYDELACPECNELYKISNETGDVMWKTTLPEGTYFGTVLIDTKNDIIIFGYYDFSFLVKYSGSTGNLIWDATGARQIWIVDTQLDKNGNIFLNVFTQDSNFIVKVNPATGNMVWSRKIEIFF